MSEELVNKIYRVTDGVVNGFFKEYRWLSNYHVCNIEWDGLLYSSTEAAYQASKIVESSGYTYGEVIQIRSRFGKMTPNESKKAGKIIVIRPDWEEIKKKIMFDINMIKFTTYPDLKEKLLATGNKELIEDNWWGDKYWGKHFGDGENHLGQILMNIREKIRIL